MNKLLSALSILFFCLTAGSAYANQEQCQTEGVAEMQKLYRVSGFRIFYNFPQDSLFYAGNEKGKLQSFSASPRCGALYAVSDGETPNGFHSFFALGFEGRVRLHENGMLASLRSAPRSRPSISVIDPRGQQKDVCDISFSPDGAVLDWEGPRYGLCGINSLVSPDSLVSGRPIENANPNQKVCSFYQQFEIQNLSRFGKFQFFYAFPLGAQFDENGALRSFVTPVSSCGAFGLRLTAPTPNGFSQFYWGSLQATVTLFPNGAVESLEQFSQVSYSIGFVTPQGEYISARKVSFTKDGDIASWVDKEGYHVVESDLRK